MKHSSTYSNLVTTVDGNGLGSLDVGYVALHSLGGDINNGVVVGRRVNVTAVYISETLGLSVYGDAVNGGVSASSASESESEDGGLHFECGMEELVG
jgi:hypothetical protein